MKQWLIRRLFYPNKHGQPVRRDPTYGRVDRDIQWSVQDMEPSSLGSRVALEDSLQRQRDWS